MKVVALICLAMVLVAFATAQDAYPPEPAKPVTLSDTDSADLEKIAKSVTTATGEAELARMRLETAKAQYEGAQARLTAAKFQYQAALLIKANAYKLNPDEFSYDPKRQSFIPLGPDPIKTSAK
jgi:phage tail sheath protein FI